MLPREIEITKRVEFSASHRLHCEVLDAAANEALYGKCVREHGHNYALETTVCGLPDPLHGMVMNLRELGQIVREEIVDVVDHRHLNHDVDLLKGVIPTAENLVIAFWPPLERRIAKLCGPRLHRLRLYETSTSWVDYYGPGASPELG